MHIAYAVIMALAVWKWADWRNWKQYNHTILFIFGIGMLYELLTKNYPLWKFKPAFLVNHTMVIILYAVITMPLSVLLFLSRYPTNNSRKLIHYIVWVGIYIGAEVLLYIFKRITFDHGWNLWWSLLFDCIMFPMLRLHYKNPLFAYILSVPIGNTQ